MRPRLLDATILSLGLIARGALDLTRLLRDPAATVQLEDGYNAAVAWMTWHGGLWGQLLDLQYKEFCGGCTVVSVVGAPVLGLFGDHLLAWRGLALTWTLLTVALGFFALRGVRREAAWAWVALMALPPPALSALGLQLWGNHGEVQLLIWGAVLAFQLRRPLLLGLMLGLGFWFCRTAVFAWVLLPLAGWSWAWPGSGTGTGPRRQIGTISISYDNILIGPIQGVLARLGLGLGLGLAPLLLPAAAGDTIGYDLGSDALGGLAQFGPRLAQLGPAELGRRLFFTDAPWPGALLLLAAAGGTALALRARQGLEIAALPWAFALGFAVSGFELPESHGQVLDSRYWGPFAATLLAATSVGLGLAWQRWRWPALVFLLPLLGAAAHTSLPRGDTRIERLPAADLVFFASFAQHRLSTGSLGASSSEHPRAEQLLRLLEGIRLGRAGESSKDPWVLQGMGLQHGREPNAGPHPLEADPDFARGQGLAQGVFDGARPGAAQGKRLLRLCGTKRSCLEAELARLSQPREAAWAYGVFLQPDALSEAQMQALAEGLGEHGEAFLEGTRHPLAGLDRPVGHDPPEDKPTHR